MKEQTEKIQNRNIFIWIVCTILSYNIIIYTRYWLSGFWINDIQLYQFAFTYQDCGYITRGLIPSITSFFKLNPLVFLYILCNISIAFYTYLICYIVNIYNIKDKTLFLISFLFLFFGIPHFALDALRFDIILQTLCLLIFILLHHNKFFIAISISILGLFIHEGIYFLLVPIFFLKMNKQNKWLFSILHSVVFLSVIFLANKISKAQAIHLANIKLQMSDVPETYHIPQESSVIDNVLYVFKAYNMFYVFCFMIIYIIILITSFKKLFSKPFLDFKWLCIFPLLICFIAADWFRWICFVYFLAMLYCLRYDTFSLKTFKIFLFTTIVLGIPLGISYKIWINSNINLFHL